MSGWNRKTLMYELTSRKGRYYLRRPVAHLSGDVHPVTWLLRSAGLEVHETPYGWNVRGTSAQIWVVLSGCADDGQEGYHEGADQLREAGLYVPVLGLNGQLV